MNLKKLFVYVPADKEDNFVNDVIKVETEAAKYANKIVFLEDSKRIWVKGNFYGSDPAEVIAITTKLDSLGNAIATSEDGLIYNDETGSYSFSKSFNNGTASTSVVKYAYAIGTYALSAGAAAAAAGAAAAAAQTKADNAYTYAGNIGHDLDAFKKKVGAIDSLTGTLKDYIDAEDASARTEVKVEGSGLSVSKTPGADGHDIYTITADQSIWEFMGTASATTSTVATVLNGKYGEGDGAVRLNPEQGDVWSVTLNDHTPQDTVLYACSAVDTTAHTGTWVVIGSAHGVTGIDTTAHNGIKLTNSANVVGLNVTPGSVASGDTSVVTGGAVFDAVETRIPETEKGASNGVAPLNASSKIDNIYITSTDDIAEDSYLPLTSYGAYAVITANERTTSAALNELKTADTDIISSYEAADANIITSYKAADTAIISSYETADANIITSYKAADTAIISSYETADANIITSYKAADAAIISSYETADTAIINSYEAADTALNTRIDNLDASYSYSYQYSSDVLYSYNLTQSDGLITVAQVVFNGDVMHNMVVDNLWEEYSAPSA